MHFDFGGLLHLQLFTRVSFCIFMLATAVTLQCAFAQKLEVFRYVCYAQRAKTLSEQRKKKQQR